MGAITITFSGTLSPNADGSDRVVQLYHTGSINDAVYAARAALNAIEGDLRELVGHGAYEATPAPAETPSPAAEAPAPVAPPEPAPATTPADPPDAVTPPAPEPDASQGTDATTDAPADGAADTLASIAPERADDGAAAEPAATDVDKVTTADSTPEPTAPADATDTKQDASPA